jgi:signal transduction histidine kinase
MNRRLRRVKPAAWDWLLGAALALGGAIEAQVASGIHGSRAVASVGVAVIGGTVALRRARPLGAMGLWLAGVAGMVAAGTTPTEISTPFLTLFLLPYAAGSRLTRGPALLALAMLWSGVAIAVAWDPRALWSDFFFPGMFGTCFWVAGRLVRSRSELTAELHEAAVRAADARAAQAAGAVADERRRIARELHDVVAHSVSMMVVQAGGARRILDRDPARAIAAAGLIEHTGREALAEMRRLLGVLHPDDHEPAAYGPQPTLRELGALVERARTAGLPVGLTVDGEQRQLSAGLDLAAYRVVQEALTNVVKHGGGAPTEVRVHYRADAVEIRIADQGDGALDVPLGGSGQGLVGMRERVRMYGGELRAGRRSDGGFEVRAVLPFEREDEAALTAGARA